MQRQMNNDKSSVDRTSIVQSATDLKSEHTRHEVESMVRSQVKDNHTQLVKLQK